MAARVEQRESTIFAETETLFNDKWEFIQDKREEQEEEQAREREEGILTERNHKILVRRLVKWRKFVSAGQDFVPINWDEDSDSEVEDSDLSSCSEDNYHHTWRPAILHFSHPDEPSCCFRKGDGKIRPFEFEENLVHRAHRWRCLQCLQCVDSSSVQQQDYSRDTGKLVNSSPLMVDSYLESEESSEEDCCVSFGPLAGRLDSDSENELNDTIEWATDEQNESIEWETGKEDNLDGEVKFEEEVDQEICSSSFSESYLCIDTEEVVTTCATSCLSPHLANESSSATDEVIVEEMSIVSRKQNRVRGPRRNIFAGFICAIIVKKFVNKFVLL